MDENFSPRVKDVIGYSKEEALRLGHDSIGTEHLVLGLIREGAGSAIELLQILNINLQEVRAKIEALHQAIENPSLSRKNIPLTRQAEKALKKRFSDLPEGLVKSESSGTTLASEDDSRPAVLQLGDLRAALSKLQ